MLTLYDYLPSQNAWKIRQLLTQLETPYQTRIVSIFEGEGQSEEYRQINPWGAVPAIRLDDGRVLSESNVILFYLAGGTAYLPEDSFAQAKVMQWLSFEGDYVQSTVGSLRYWSLTGKMDARPPEVVTGRRQVAEKALGVLDAYLRTRTFLVEDRYSVADIAIYAYGAHAEEGGIALEPYPNFSKWTDRVREQPGHLAERFPYSIDPHAMRELP